MCIQEIEEEEGTLGKRWDGTDVLECWKKHTRIGKSLSLERMVSMSTTFPSD